LGGRYRDVCRQGYPMAMGTVIGVGIGAAIGAAFGNIAIGIAIGISLGAPVATFWVAERKR
jgi:uncharacterized membrane protein YgaE (UPF0421/DUF939 family)